MAIVPAICDSCGVAWGAENLFGGNARNVTMTGNKVGPCPNCGGMGSIPDGVYDFQDDAMKVVQSAGIPAPALQELIGTLESLRRGEASPEQVIERVESDAPALAPTVRKALAKPNTPAWIAVLIMLLTLYLQAQTPRPPTASEVADEIRSKPIPTYRAPPPEPKPKEKRKRPPKTHGQGKHRKSRKRR